VTNRSRKKRSPINRASGGLGQKANQLRSEQTDLSPQKSSGRKRLKKKHYRGPLTKASKGRSKSAKSGKLYQRPHVHSVVDGMNGSLDIGRSYRPIAKTIGPYQYHSPRRVKMEYFGKVFHMPGFYSESRLQIKIVSNDLGFRSTRNKLLKMFGPKMARNKRFRYLLSLIAITGFTRSDFWSLIRIRDIFVRGCYKTFLSMTQNMILSLPGQSRIALAAVLAKPRRRTSHFK